MKFIVLAFYLRLRIFAHHFVGCNSRSRQPITRLCKAVENRLNRNDLPGSFSNTSILHLALLRLTNMWTVREFGLLQSQQEQATDVLDRQWCRGLLPTPSQKKENWGCRKILRISSSSWTVLVQRNAKSEAVKPPLWGNLGTKFKLWATIILCVRNLQLSVGILSKIFSVRRKITASCLAYFFHPRHCCVQPQTWDHWLRQQLWRQETSAVTNHKNYCQYLCHAWHYTVNGVAWCFCCMKAQYMFSLHT